MQSLDNQLNKHTHLFQSVQVSHLSVCAKQRRVSVGTRFNPCSLHHSQDVLRTLDVPAQMTAGLFK